MTLTKSFKDVYILFGLILSCVSCESEGEGVCTSEREQRKTERHRGREIYMALSPAEALPNMPKHLNCRAQVRTTVQMFGCVCAKIQLGFHVVTPTKQYYLAIS